MRLPAGLGLALAVVALLPLGHAQTSSLALQPIPDQEAEFREEVRQLLVATHDCPVEGMANFTAQGPPGFDLTTYSVAWERCRGQSTSRALSALLTFATNDARSGSYDASVTVRTDDGDSTTQRFKIHMGYDASVQVEGPRLTLIAPGQRVAFDLNVTVTANGDSRLALSHDAPDGWNVQAEPERSLTFRRGAQKVRWPVAVVPAATASGDTRITFTVDASSPTSEDEHAEVATFSWFARVPADPGRGSVAEQAEEVKETPAWVYGAILVVGAVAALWWARRQ